MAAYIVSTVRVTDAEKFGAYSRAIAGLCEKHGGEYIVRGGISAVLEGEIDPSERVVVVRFPDAESAKAYTSAPEYLAGVKLREGAGTVEMRLIVEA